MYQIMTSEQKHKLWLQAFNMVIGLYTNNWNHEDQVLTERRLPAITTIHPNYRKSLDEPGDLAIRASIVVELDQMGKLIRVRSLQEAIKPGFMTLWGILGENKQNYFPEMSHNWKQIIQNGKDLWTWATSGDPNNSYKIFNWYSEDPDVFDPNICALVVVPNSIDPTNTDKSIFWYGNILSFLATYDLDYNVANQKIRLHRLANLFSTMSSVIEPTNREHTYPDDQRELIQNLRLEFNIVSCLPHLIGKTSNLLEQILTWPTEVIPNDPKPKIRQEIMKLIREQVDKNVYQSLDPNILFIIMKK